MSEANSNEQQEHRGGRRFIARPKFCQFCSEKDVKIVYKNTDLLRRYVTEEGKIRPRRQTGTCAKHQRKVAAAVKKARFIALLPYTSEPYQDVVR
jgi:small subunit ribosomal protein S18